MVPGPAKGENQKDFKCKHESAEIRLKIHSFRAVKLEAEWETVWLEVYGLSGRLPYKASFDVNKLHEVKDM
jgi:hypothetical protein